MCDISEYIDFQFFFLNIINYFELHVFDNNDDNNKNIRYLVFFFIRLS